MESKKTGIPAGAAPSLNIKDKERLIAVYDR